MVRVGEWQGWQTWAGVGDGYAIRQGGHAVGMQRPGLLRALDGINDERKFCWMDTPLGTFSSGISHKNFLYKTLCQSFRSLF